MSDLKLQHLEKIYDNKVQAVYDFDLDVKDGELIVLVGPSGCGKSTTLRMVAGLEDISNGNLIIDGKDVTQMPPKDRDIAMVFQNYALYGHMTVYENMAFSLMLRKENKNEIHQKVMAAAEILDLTSQLNKKPGQLSSESRDGTRYRSYPEGIPVRRAALEPRREAQKRYSPRDTAST